MDILDQFKMSSTVIGIDLGAADALVAYVGRGHVDIVRNEVSERKTPSVVGFTSANRLLGEAAMSQIKSNGPNTCRFQKLLVGRSLEAAVADGEAFWQLCKLEKAASGEAGYAVDYLGERRVFSATEVTSMLFTRLIETTDSFVGTRPKDCVISVPSYFGPDQRQAILDAAQIAGLNCLRVFNDHAAVALGYGLYRTADFDETTPTNVVFVNIGHTYTSVSVAQFVKNQLTVLAEHSSLGVCGRAIERKMIDFCANAFAAKYPAISAEKLLNNVKAKYKLEEAVAKAKKTLSANSEAGVNIECLYEEYDLHVSFTRPSIEALCCDIETELAQLITAALSTAAIPLENIHHIEIVGGCSRIPFIQRTISSVCGNKELSRTLNADECVARGCALMAAILSPLFKVRDFVVNDFLQHSVDIVYTSNAVAGPVEADEGEAEAAETQPQTAAGLKRITVFPALKSKLNTTKVMSFLRRESLELQAEIPEIPNKVIGRYRVAIPAELVGSSAAVKVKVRTQLTAHGTLVIDGAHAVVEEEVEELVKEEDSETKETVEVLRKKMKTKKVELMVEKKDEIGLSSDALIQLENAEGEMIINDNEIRARDVARNNLEAFILSTRNKLVSDEDKNKYETILCQAEDWVYDNYDSNKATLVDKLFELTQILAPLLVQPTPTTDEGQGPEPMNVEPDMSN